MFIQWGSRLLRYLGACLPKYKGLVCEDLNVYRWDNLRHLNWWQTVCSHAAPCMTSKCIVRRWCAAGQHCSRHDRCRLYATSEWHFTGRDSCRGGMLRKDVPPPSPCVLKTQQCARVSKSRPIYTAAHQLWTFRAEGKMLQCWGHCYENWLLWISLLFLNRAIFIYYTHIYQQNCT